MENKENKFPETKLTFALVLHASLEDIQRIKEYLSGLDDLQVVYQKCSASKLFIREKVEE